ncbi:MAG: hypothetical protein RML36_15820 [Anaerolineae bacterium]|nr:hypothetical protein [Anaerolineae bacterium]MDW8100941.1 hypothetical protein [Anaerolineae bacterium]
MTGRWFYATSGAILMIIPLFALSLTEKAISKALLIAVAAGALRTESILDVPRYAFAASVTLELLGLCIGAFLLTRAIFRW